MDGSSAAIEVLVQNLIDVFKQEYYLIRDVDEHAKQLQKTLGIIQAYLNDAEKKSITLDTVKIWLRELEALAFDADNALDELSYLHLRSKVKKSKTPIKKVQSFFPSVNHVARQRNMSHTIKQINKDFESMHNRATELGLQSVVVSAPAVAPHASFETDSFILDPIFIGRDDVLSEIVDLVIESPKERKFFVLAIVGMGGMGKTALTRRVFHHEKIETRFGSHIWVHVSQTFDPFTLFKKILRELGRSDQVESRQDVMKKLQEALKDETYLLVLDDVWNEDVPQWEDFMNSVSGVTSTEGNAIIITTRSTRVSSSIANPLYIHHLRGLSCQDCWTIIKAKAFENGDDVPQGLETIGEKIVKRCKGLPLAANVVGGVLRHKSEEEWLSVEQNWLTDVEGDHISKILRMSYGNLFSPSLKKCFTYCSFFPKGRCIVKEELIEMWMAEGYLQSHGRNDMESLGDMYFNVLVHNSLLQVAEGGNYAHVMHDLVHDLARSVLRCWNDADGIRYSYREEKSHCSEQAPMYLRTLVFKGDISGIVFSDFVSLHVLTLKCFGAKEFPESIRKLIHLRRLNISSTSIERLPKWIGELHHLQTLRADTGYLEKLPSSFKYLINLRHLHIYSDVQLPAGIGRLTCLQTLEVFKVRDKRGYRIQELGSLNNLKGKLEIHNLEKVRSKEEEEKANISLKPNLLELKFEWGASREGETNDESVLGGLQPHPNLNKLGIFGYKGKTFPSWFLKMIVGDGLPLNKLIEMTLVGCSEFVEIPRLDYLPNLKFLYLIRLEKVRFIHSPFSELKSLRIDDLDALECLPDWLFYKNPDLTRMEISRCPKLREIPDGLHTLDHLEHLYIYKCPNLKSMGSYDDNNIPSGAWESHLQTLSIGRCRGLKELPRRMVELWAPSLETLSLDGLSSLENLPLLVDCLGKSATRLRELSIVGVPNFMATHNVESGWDLGSLWSLKIGLNEEDLSRESSSVGNKESVDGILKGCCNSLAHLKLSSRGNWECIPESIQYLTDLSSLTLENFGVEELPRWFGNLSSLRCLYLSSCSKLRRLPAGDAYKDLTILHSLEIKDCPELEVDSEWRNIPRLHINVDGRPIESRFIIL